MPLRAMFLLLAALFLAPASSFAQGNLDQRVARSRTSPITPRRTTPSWLDWQKLERGFDYLKQNEKMIGQVLGTSSLAATFAAKDIAPLLVQTGRLITDFDRRMAETGAMMSAIMSRPKSREEFERANFARGYELGVLHQQVARSGEKGLAWDPRVRVPMSQQSVAFVLFTFAWWPYEAVSGQKQPGDPSPTSPEIEGWFHFWSVVGYAMGVDEELLPVTMERASRLVGPLREAQYVSRDERVPDGVPALLGAHVRSIARQLAGTAADKAARDKMIPLATLGFSVMIHRSRGLAEALGLDKQVNERLTEFAKQEIR